MRIAVDLDGTLRTEERRHDKIFAQPIEGAIEEVNRLYDEGHDIFIHTACNWEEYHITKAWLDMFNVKYHALICGKPNYDVVIDDRSWPSVERFVNAHSARKRK